ncbi:tRNA 2-selenouridine(34) synthase MnmH [Frigidibacter sp. RF13]|uniref:tRNA 2-selenouridine(34) synthase MnmH n=1 Tax=Frigidibacter sp. RF13 TaxID=2997340 RepID=UPI0022703536|nr:tRNA 2-selenouridine(34) synthase MnmH [Frigidibacter sp. RF13]MCY1127688.1 tRNA 2-selenouridine(34) synthase MnmH [Frigidibacter sp. RF13]
MALSLTSLTQLETEGFDTVIDVRATAEYAEDHLPGAISLPVLDDEERARVGTIYKQESPFRARKVGAALVARNAASHIEGPLAEKPGGWRPLVYCWRGGQRSNSFASILAQIGWRVEVLEGGYKAWRALVLSELNDRPFAAPLWVLDGNTGTAKTEVLARLATLGVQTIDIEALANHRGSLFGHREGGQPGQKAFDSHLAMAIARIDTARPVVVEAESSRIGDLNLPKQLWKAMCAAPRIRIAAPLEARAAYLTRAYADLTADPERLARVVESLRPVQPAERIADWLTLARAGDFQALAAGLMRDHYDRRYEKHRARFGREEEREIATDRLDPDAIDTLAQQIADTLLTVARPNDM